MFFTYRYSVDGRRFDRYYEKWENAKKQLLTDASSLQKDGAKRISSHDYFNAGKGFYVYEKEYKHEGMTFNLSILDCFFSD